MGGWIGSRPRIVSLQPNALADVWSDIALVADAIGDAAAGRRLIAELQGRVSNIAERAAALSGRPSVACIEWIDPLMAAGNWMRARGSGGKRNLFGRPENIHRG